RQAYYEHPDYVPLVRRAYERWYDLEQHTGRHLLTECGLLSIGTLASELIQGVRLAANEHGLAVEELSAVELRRRFPPFRFNTDYVGLLERSAGFLSVEDCVRAHIEAARAAGAAIQDQETVRAWEANASSVAVQTDKGRYTAAKLVL